MFYVSSNEVKTEANKLVTKSVINDQKLSVSETSSGESFTVVSIFKEEDNVGDEIIRKSISEIELSRGDCVLVNYDNVVNKFEVNIIHKSGNTFWK